MGVFCRKSVGHPIYDTDNMTRQIRSHNMTKKKQIKKTLSPHSYHGVISIISSFRDILERTRQRAGPLACAVLRSVF